MLGSVGASTSGAVSCVFSSFPSTTGVASVASEKMFLRYHDPKYSFHMLYKVPRKPFVLQQKKTGLKYQCNVLLLFYLVFKMTRFKSSVIYKDRYGYDIDYFGQNSIRVITTRQWYTFTAKQYIITVHAQLCSLCY